MKKTLLISLLLSCLAIILHAQVKTVTKPAVTNKVTPVTGSKSTATIQENKVAQISKVIPKPDKINFPAYRKQFVSAPSKKINSFERRTLSNRVNVTMVNSQQTTNSKNIMDNTTTGFGKKNNTLATQRSNLNSNLNMLPSVTRKTSDGSSVSYYLRSPSQISNWEQGSKYKPNLISQSPDSYDPNKKMKCHTTIMTFNAQSTSFLSAQPEMQGSNLLPGMIFDFSDLSKGNFNQKYNVNRAPIALTCDVFGSSGSITADVTNPNKETIVNGLQSIIRNFGGNPGGSDVQMQITKTESTAEQDILIAGGGSYGAFSGQASFQQNKSSYHLYYTIDAIKSLYTVGVMPGSNGLYNQGANVPNDGFPVMLTDETFGARVLANMDIEVSSETDAGDISFNYNDGMESAWAKFKGAISNKNLKVTINGYLIGFPAKFGGSFSAESNNFLSMLETFFNGCDYASAKPIQYALVNTDGDYMGIESITDKATIQECVPANENFKLAKATLILSTGSDDKYSNSEFWLSIATGDPLNPKWVGRIYDNHSEFKKDGNPYQIPIPVNTNATLTEFLNGGFIALKLIEHHGGNDDWEFQKMDIILDFVSESGTPKTSTISLGSFIIHDTKNSQNDSKDIIFMSDGQGNFKPKQ